VFRPSGLLAHKDLYIIWLSNLSILMKVIPETHVIQYVRLYYMAIYYTIIK
jgi:hypothetical protein